jgi:hypothetical protein
MEPPEKSNEWDADFLEPGVSDSDTNEIEATPTASPNARASQLKQRRDEDFLDVPHMKVEKPLYDLAADHRKPEVKRPCPLFLDVFLYPLNRAGLLTLAVIFGGPLALGTLSFFCYFLMRTVPILIFISVPVIMASVAVTFGMILFYLWYVCECLRESSSGTIRAPETMGHTPGIMDLFCQLFQVICCLLLFISTYLSTVHSFALEGIARLLLMGVLVFVFPMVFLGVVSSDSFRGFHPVPVVKNTARCFIPYCIVVSVLGGLHILPTWLIRLIPGMTEIIKWRITIADIVLVLAEVYLLMVSAHIIGWFAYKYRERLEW